jgi:hypothetical protein
MPRVRLIAVYGRFLIYFPALDMEQDLCIWQIMYSAEKQRLTNVE